MSFFSFIFLILIRFYSKIILSLYIDIVMHQLQINFYYYYWNQQNQSINNWLIIIFHIFWKWFWYIERIGLSFPTFFNIHTVKLFIFYHSFILLSLLLPLSDLFRVSSLNVNQHWLNHWFFFFFSKRCLNHITNHDCWCRFLSQH